MLTATVLKSSVCIASCAYQYYIIIFNNIKIIGKFAGFPQSKKEHVVLYGSSSAIKQNYYLEQTYFSLLESVSPSGCVSYYCI